MSNELKEVRVTDRNVQCTYSDVESVAARSHWCGSHATTTVKLKSGNRTWRCPEHQGMINATEVGETTFTRDDVDPRLIVSWPERQE